MINTVLPVLDYQTDTERGALDFSSLLVSGDKVAHGEQPIELIVVPAARSHHNLAYAMQLAKESGAQLVVLASHDTSADAAAKLFAQSGASGFVGELPRDYVLPLSADFATSTHAFANHTSNLSDKRNLGLLLSHLMSTNVFFLDDDIRGLSVKQLRQSGGLLRNGYTAAGFWLRDYPDNSVVCHANRLAGGKQSQFISGNSLATADKFAATAFFPKIYNEDWLFMHDAAAKHEAAILDTVRQLPYDPFRNPARATSEEFGDTLAEGLYYLLTTGQTFQDVGEDYWRFAISRRKDFIDGIAERLTGKLDDELAARALTSLNAAKLQLEKFTPRDFTNYVQAWRDDIGRWQERVRKLPRTLSLNEAAAFLDLPIRVAKR